MSDVDILTFFDPIALVPKYKDEYLTEMWTYQGIYPSKLRTTKLIDEFCIRYGADLKGRENAARKCLGIKKRPPIIISHEYELAAIQAPMPHYRDPIWIIDLDFDCQPVEPKLCKLLFKNNLALTVALSEETLKNKKAQALQLLYEIKYCQKRRRLYQQVLEKSGEYPCRIVMYCKGVFLSWTHFSQVLAK